MMLLDTHALIWWTLDPAMLSRRAKKACERIQEEGVCLSSISIWEIGIKIKNKKLNIGISLEEYLGMLRTMNTVEIIPVDENIWIESINLDWENRDPADRVIVATAKIRGLSILSKDEKIRKFYKRTIW